jgi:hypothetical protein
MNEACKHIIYLHPSNFWQIFQSYIIVIYILITFCQMRLGKNYPF